MAVAVMRCSGRKKIKHAAQPKNAQCASVGRFEQEEELASR